MSRPASKSCGMSALSSPARVLLVERLAVGSTSPSIVMRYRQGAFPQPFGCALCPGLGSTEETLVNGNMMFTCSLPLLALLQKAEITPERLNAALSARVRNRLGQMIEVVRLPRLIARSTGFSTPRIYRRNRTIFVEVRRGPITYREQSRKDCILLFPGTLPEQTVMALSNKIVSDVVDLGPAAADLFGNVEVIGAVDSWSGSTCLALATDWKRFPSH